MKKQFVALTLAGLMLLPACVKDVESPSVTAARQAKAEQLASITALNNANAQAQLTLANAEAALKAAEAKAKEAEALKLSAEADLVKVQAELAAVEVEIAKVKLEEEKVALEIKKAELEAKLVQLETLKAQAEVTKKKAAAELERLAIDIQTQLLLSQKALIDARRAYINAANGYDADLANDYFNACNDLYQAQQNLASTQILLAQAQNDLIDLNEAKAKRIIDNNNSIAKYKILIERFESMRGLSVEELAQKELEAYAVMQDAGKDLNVAWSEYNTVKDNYYDVNNSIWASYQRMRDAFVNEPVYDNGRGEYQFWYNSQYISLFTTQSSDWQTYSCSAAPYIYESVYVITPSKLNKEGMELLVEVKKETAKKNLDNDLSNLEQELTSYKDNLSRNEQNLARAEANVAEYQAEYDAAKDNYDSAKDAYLEAMKLINDYLSANYDGDWSEYREARARYYQASDNYLDAQNAYLSYPVEAAQSSVEYWEERVASGENALKQAKDAVSEDDAAAVETAQAKVDAQKAVVAAKQTAYDEAYAAMRAAKLANLATPSTENQAAYDEAVTALAEAETNLNTETGKLTDLETALADAEAVVENQLVAVKNAEDNLAFSEYRLPLSKEDLEKSIAAKQAMDEAKEAETAAKSAMDAASEKLRQYFNYDSEYQKLVSAKNEAWDAMDNAESLKDKAYAALEDAQDRNNYYGLQAWVLNCGLYIKKYESQIEARNSSYAVELQKIDQLEQAVNEIIAGEAEYLAAVEQYNGELRESLIAAFESRVHADIEYDEASADYSAAYTALSDAESLEDNINNYYDWIERLEADNEDLSTITNKETYIAHLKSQIAGYESQVALLKSKVDEAKKALDAATSVK